MIECLRISGNSRLDLSLIQSIEITPQDRIQIILGRNGSGKTSLMREWTPLPGEHKDYHKGGSKYVRIHRQGLTFELTSTFNRGTGHHSFYIKEEDRELNKGGTLAVQRELVMHYFNVNRERMDILLGAEKFTAMSPLKRQEWLTLLTPTSLDYAFGVYDKLKSLKRDKDGVVKHHQQRLAKETKEVPSDAEQKAMREQLSQMVKKAEALMGAKYSVTPSNDPTLNPESLKTRLNAIVRDVKKTLTVHPTLPFKFNIRDEEAFNEALNATSHEVSRYDALLDHLSNEYRELKQQQPKKDENLTEEMVQSIRQEIKQIDEDINNTSPSQERVDRLFVEPVTIGNMLNFEVVLEEMVGGLICLIHEFPDNSDGRLSREQYARAKVEVSKCDNYLLSLEHRRDTILGRLQQLKTCRSVVCPNCEHSFREGVDENEPVRLEKELEEIGPNIDKVKAQGEKIRSYMDEVDDFRRLLTRFRQFSESYPMFGPLWEKLINDRIMVTNPKSYVNSIIEWLQVMQTLAAIKRLTDRRDVLSNKLRYIEEIDQGTIDRVNQKLTQVESSIEEVNKKRALLLKQKEALESYGKTNRLIIDNQRRLSQELEQVLRDFDQLRDDYYHDALQKESNSVQLSMGQLKHQLSEIEVRNGVLDYLHKQLEESIQQQEDLKLLVKAMCPKDGLIGKYLMGFMNNVVKFMNAIIARVWTYDLEIQPSKVDKDRLDYRFPLIVGGGEKSTPDIKDGSGSQVDIVDFAFRLLVMKFLKLEEFPLYFDEFGITFDEEHRANLNLLINSMIENNQTTQVVYISHYMQEHTSLSNADVCVIDPNNITVPKVYNQHVVIK